MNTSYQVRPALGDDLPGVLSVLGQNQADVPTEAALPDDKPSELQVATWARVQASPDVTVYVAESASGKAVGTVCLSILPNITYDCRPTAFIEAVVVAYAHRRRGVATALMQRVIDDARAAGCFKLQLLTHKRHATDGAHNLYSSVGFAPEAEGFRLYLT